MDRLLLDSERPATLVSVREIRRLLQRIMVADERDEAVRNRVALCFSEAAANLVEHGADSVTRIRVRFGSDGGLWLLELWDDGTSWNSLEQPADHQLSPRLEFAESGRGIALLTSQCDRAVYRAGADGEWNSLRLEWRRNLQRPQPSLLVVEDEPVQGRLYEAYLSGDYRVQRSASGREALDLLSRTKVDLVLSDINMPEMDGIALRERLAADAELELIPFIFLTADEDDAMLQRASNLGIDDYLRKPVDKARLLQTVARVLGRSGRIKERLSERIGGAIRDALKPTLPEAVPGWRLAMAVRNTGIGGGDFLLSHGDGESTTVLLADVMGHDETAKFFAHAYAGYLRGLMLSQGSNDAGQLLSQLSSALMTDRVLSQSLLTCAAVTLLPGGEVTLGSAGHPAPLLIDAAGLERVECAGMLPGLVADPGYGTKRLRLQTGERLALFTDGLFESAGDEQGRERLTTLLLETLQSSRDLSLERALRRVMEQFDRVAGDVPADDALLLLIEPE